MQYFGEFIALLTAFMWSISSFAFTSAAHRIGTLQLNINRMILAAVFLFITILVLNFNFEMTQRQFIYLTISGVIGLIIGDTFLFKAYQHIGARLGMLLMALSPVVSAVLAFYFLDETLAAWGIIGMVVTIGGIALVILERNETPNSKYKISKIGIFYGFMGAVGQSIGLVFAKFAFQEGDLNGFVATFVRVFSSLIILLPLAMAAKKYKNPFALYKNDRKAFTSTITGTFFGPYLGITCSLIAIEYAKLGIAATLMSTMPIIMLPIVRFYYKETLSPRAILGAILAVAGVAVIFLR